MEILSFDQGAEPLSLLLLMDVSGSMRPYVDQVASAARQALRVLGPKDQVALMIFARTAKVRREWTRNFGAVADDLRESVRDRSVGSVTELNRSILAAARHFAEQPPEGRRAILMLTDNRGMNYQAPDEETIEALLAQSVVLDVLLAGDPEEQKKRSPIANDDFSYPDVPRIARETGGEAERVRQAGGAFAERIERIRARYSLTFAAPADAAKGFHAIRVELSAEARRRHGKAVLFYRRGYVVR